MSASTDAAAASFKAKFCPLEKIKPFMTPYYLTVIAVLGAITVVFAVLTGVIVLVVTNFNILGLIE